MITDARARVSRARDLIARCPAPDGLSAREAEVLQLLAMRRTNRAIAVALHVSVHTIERHLQSAYRKIGAATEPTPRHTWAALAADMANPSAQPTSAPPRFPGKGWRAG